jgi:hypothetical protein
MVFAMAGLEEMALLYGLRIVASALVVIAGLLVLAYWKQSTVASAIAAVLLLLVSLQLEPWTAFTRPSSDPDDVYWTFWVRVASAFWAILVVVAAACIIRLIRRKRFEHLKSHGKI